MDGGKEAGKEINLKKHVADERKKHKKAIKAICQDKKCKKKVNPPTRIPSSEDHVLSHFGYSEVKKMSSIARHRVLVSAINSLRHKHGEHSALITIIHELVARYNLLHKRTPDIAEIMKRDSEWVSGLLEKWKRAHTKK
jgi:hypothetical protein